MPTNNNHSGSANYNHNNSHTMNINSNNNNINNNMNANSFCTNNSNNNIINNNNNNNNNNMNMRPFPLRILVQSDVVGAIIGRSGSTIKNITQQTKARIDVHREESPDQQEKVITINGSPDNCSEACFKIVEVIQNEIIAKYDNDETLDTDRDITLKILASNNLIGRLIGKSGSTIKRMMEQTSTRISISTNCITESTGEHTIVVIGKLEKVKQAERLISTKLRAALLSDMNTSMLNMSQPPYLFNNVMLPYMPNPYTQNSILASIVNPQAGHSGNPMARTLPLTAPHQGQITNSMYTPTSYLPLYQNSNLPHGASNMVGFNPVASCFDQERETVYIYIPSNMVGAIIGKSGTAIKEMISTSGASIKVATAAPVEPQRQDQSHEDSQKASDQDQSNPADSEHVTCSGTSGDESTNQSSATSPRISRYQSGSNDPLTTRKVSIVGYPSSQYSAQFMIYRKIAIESGKGDISLMVELSIPSQFVGKIIGKGGATVKALQKQTRTTIRLPEDKSNQSQASENGGNPESCVQITGDFEGSQAAQRHIKNMLRKFVMQKD